MQEFIRLYNQNREDIERFLIETIRINGQFMTPDAERVTRFFGLMPSLELVYITDPNYIQISNNISKQKSDPSGIGKNRDYLVSKMTHSEDQTSVSAPYVSLATDQACVTVMVLWDKHYYFFDFNLTNLLSRFGLVERHPVFNQVSKIFYFRDRSVTDLLFIDVDRLCILRLLPPVCYSEHLYFRKCL
ncbi:MAG: hypothetical protein U9R28_04840 [Pseudomonadota bacterium]|nr:hypothetical protein [Pseudomonadota bacterium]